VPVIQPGDERDVVTNEPTPARRLTPPAALFAIGFVVASLVASGLLFARQGSAHVRFPGSSGAPLLRPFTLGDAAVGTLISHASTGR